MYKNKPVVWIRPWYRHPYFPWGWYSICRDNGKFKIGENVYADGYKKPFDGRVDEVPVKEADEDKYDDEFLRAAEKVVFVIWVLVVVVIWSLG